MCTPRTQLPVGTALDLLSLLNQGICLLLVRVKKILVLTDLVQSSRFTPHLISLRKWWRGHRMNQFKGRQFNRFWCKVYSGRVHPVSWIETGGFQMTDYFKGRQFNQSVITFAVGYYLRYNISYRDLVEMMRDRGIFVHHTTLMRWVQHYSPIIAGSMA